MTANLQDEPPVVYPLNSPGRINLRRIPLRVLTSPRVCTDNDVRCTINPAVRHGPQTLYPIFALALASGCPWPELYAGATQYIGVANVETTKNGGFLEKIATSLIVSTVAESGDSQSAW